jgi:NAD(P)H dehydrogenase (quinone)
MPLALEDRVMSTIQRIVVTGAAGDQASAISRQLVLAGFQVVGITRSAARAERIQQVGAQPVVASNEELAAVFSGADAVVYTSSTDYRPGVREAQAAAIVTAVRTAKVPHIVYNAAADADERLTRRVAQVLRDQKHVLEASGAAVTTLYPTVYMDNLGQPWCLDAIRGGALPYPVNFTTRMSWISHRALGDFVVAAIRQFEGASRTFRIGGPEALTLPQVADLVGQRVGHAVAPVSVPVPDFAASLNQAFGAPAGDDIGDFYQFVANHPDAVVRTPQQWAPLAVEPESLTGWLARQDW